MYNLSILLEENVMNKLNSKRIIKKVLAFFVFLSILGCSSSVEKVSIHSENLTLNIKQKETLSLSIEPQDSELNINDFYLTENGIVEIIEYKDNKLIIQTLQKVGSTTLSYKNSDIESNSITIDVIDKEALALAEAKKKEELEKQKAEEIKKQEELEKQKAEEVKKQEELKKQQTAKAEQKKTEQQKQSSSQSATTSNSSSNQANSSSTKATGENVYIPRTGKKYHSHSNCGNMKNPSLVSLNEAENRGFTPCKKCY